jgi:potassium-dependent mechanosensitive channel
MITRIWIRQLAFLGLAVALLVAGALPGGRAWAEPAEEPSFESIKMTLDEIEEAVGRDDVTQETLVELRQKLNATADTLRGKIDELEPRVNEAEERLKQLGPAPAKDAPPESQEIADQRKELTESFSELDGALKQARVLSVRIEQLSERV